MQTLRPTACLTNSRKIMTGIADKLGRKGIAVNTCAGDSINARAINQGGREKWQILCKPVEGSVDRPGEVMRDSGPGAVSLCLSVSVYHRKPQRRLPQSRGSPAPNSSWLADVVWRRITGCWLSERWAETLLYAFGPKERGGLFDPTSASQSSAGTVPKN